MNETNFSGGTEVDLFAAALDGGNILGQLVDAAQARPRRQQPTGVLLYASVASDGRQSSPCDEYSVLCARDVNSAAERQAGEDFILIEDSDGVGTADPRIRTDRLGPLTLGHRPPKVGSRLARRRLWCDETIDDADTAEKATPVPQQATIRSDGQVARRASLPLLRVHAMAASGSLSALRRKASAVRRKNDRAIAKARRAVAAVALA